MRVTAKELRQKFNSGDYMEQAKSGKLSPRLGADNHPAPPKSGQPFCTRSQFLSYHDKQGNKFFSVHQYKRLDGTIGGSGLPEPKELLIDGEIYYV
jgi:hypothetical protein